MKKLSLLMALSMLTTACSKTVKEINNNQIPSDSSAVQVPEVNETNINELISEVLNSKASNFAFAEFLSRTVSKDQRENARKFMLELSPKEIEAILTRVKQDNDSIRKQYLFHGKDYQVNNTMIENSLLSKKGEFSNSLSYDDHVRLTAFTYIKDKTLGDIIRVYTKNAEDLASDIAKQIVVDMAKDEPAETEKIRNNVKGLLKDEVIEALKKNEKILGTMDKYLKKSELNENEQLTLLGTGLVLAGVYTIVKDDKTFNHVVKEAKTIIQDVKDIISKGKLLLALSGALESNIRSTERSVRELKEGIQGSREDFTEMLDSAKKAAHKSSDIHSKRIMDFLYNKVIKGKDVKEGQASPSILSKQVRFNANLNKSIKAAGEMAGNLSNILDTTNKMLAVFKVKPSKDVMKIMDKAQKVAMVVSSVQTITAGFTAAGPIGALAALGSSSIGSSLLGGGKDKSDEHFNLLDRKLTMVLENQAKMMEAQVETMKMIKDLALLVDQYHQKEMMALAELRDYTLVNLEISKTMLNKDIRSCERIINFQLSSVWKDQDFKINSLYGMNEIKLVTSRFSENVGSLQDVRRLINSVESHGFEKCQNGIAEAFGGNSVSENPLRSLFSSSDDSNLLGFQRDTYSPLLDLLYEKTGTSQLDSIPLHIPAANIAGLNEKNLYLTDASRNYSTDNVYDMEDLVSTKGLERYLSQLLILHPLFEVNAEDWDKNINGIVKTYLENSKTDGNQNVRSHYFLNNALKLVQSGIAQESLLAGEPLLIFLQEKYLAQVLSNQKCEGSICAVRRNKLLMKNFISYLLHNLHSEPAKLAHYRENFKVEKAAILSKFFFPTLPAENFIAKNVEGAVIVHIVVTNERGEKVEIRLPTPDQIESGDSIMYSENMERLLQMQSAILDALEKVSPFQRPQRGPDLLKMLTFGVQ